MSGAPRIGVLGAYGAVGLAVTRALGAAGLRLRVAGRNAAQAEAIAGGLGVRGEAMAVDATRPSELDGFCGGCRIVVNCAGPSSLIGDAVARAADRAGAACVDAGGDEALAQPLSGIKVPAVLAAGISPGLTGILPRWLAGQLPEPARALRAWCGGLQRFTPAAAADMVASLHDGYGTALAAWRGGRLMPRALAPLPDAAVPHFPGRVAAYPYLSVETQRMAARLGLSEVQWFNVFAGRQTLAVLNQLRAQPAAADAGRAAARLIDAAEVDTAGLRPYQLMVLELSGASQVRTAVVRGDDGYRLTAAVAVAAVEALLDDGAVPPGAHLAAEVLDPDRVVAALGRGGAAVVVHLSDQPADAAVEEGVL